MLTWPAFVSETVIVNIFSNNVCLSLFCNAVRRHHLARHSNECILCMRGIISVFWHFNGVLNWEFWHLVTGSPKDTRKQLVFWHWLSWTTNYFTVRWNNDGAITGRRNFHTCTEGKSCYRHMFYPELCMRSSAYIQKRPLPGGSKAFIAEQTKSVLCNKSLLASNV